MSNYVMLDRIEEVQYLGLQMLITFDKVCREEGYAYSLAGGTLLGAIRHKGFIPWDDDVDVFMLREDYEMFLNKYAGKKIGNDHYHIYTSDKGIPGSPTARMIDDRTHVNSVYSTSWNNIWIDICPLDKLPEKLEDRTAWISELRRKRKIRLMLNARPFSGKTKSKAILKTPVAIIGRALGMRERICHELDQESQKFRDGKSDLSVEVVAQATVKGIVCRSTFHQSIEVEFEGHIFKAIPDYNEYLTGQYGYYWALPPVEKQKAHRIHVEVILSEYTKEEQEYLTRLIYKKDIAEANQKQREEMDLTTSNISTIKQET